jgi:hypothetical protein
MRRIWLPLTSLAVFILTYVLCNDLFRWFLHHQSPSLHTLPQDLLRAFTVAIFYFLADLLIKRLSARKRSA